MKLKNLFIVFYSLISIFLILLGILAFVMLDIQKDTAKIQDLHFQAYKLANELKESSDALTLQCKTYVLTEDPIWEEKYWETLDIRNGKKPRPDGKTIALQDSLKKLPLTDEERNLLIKAESNSNKLVMTERTAFYAVKGIFDDGKGNFSVKKTPDIKLAKKLLFGDQYNTDKSTIMNPIQDFITLIAKRTSEELISQNNKTSWLIRGKIVLILIIAAITVISFFILKEKIIKKLDELEIAYKKLEESEEKFRRFMDSVPGLAYIKKHDTRVEFCNAGFKTYLGIDPDVIINKMGDEIFPPEFAKKILEDDMKILESGKTEIFEEQFAGRLWSTHKFIIPRIDNPPYLGGISIDITDAKTAEEMSRKLFRAVEQSSVSVVITDLKGNIEYVNPKFINLTGYSFEEVKGQNPRVLKSDSAQSLNIKYENLWQTISSGKEWKGEFCNKKKNGELYWESASISPIFDNNGIVTHYLAIKEDITEKRKIEKALAESEEKYRILFADSPDAYLIILDGVYADCNKSAEKMLKIDKSKIIGKVPGALSPEFQPDGHKSLELMENYLNAALRTGSCTFEWLHKRSDGTSFYSEISVTTITFEGKRAFFTTWRDITERKQAEKALKINEARLEEAQAIAHIGNWEIDLTTLQINGSDEALRIFGIEKTGSAFPLKYIQMAALPEFRPVLDKTLSDLLEFGESYDVEYKIKRFNDGSIRWIHSKAEMVSENNGGSPRVMGIIQDITERKTVEEELQKNRTFLYDIIENNGALIYVKDNEGVYQLVNRKWEETTGLKKEEVIGRRDRDVFPPEIGERYRNADLEVMHYGGVKECEEILETDTGNRYFISIKFPMKEVDNEIKGICGISTEITERKESESRIKKYADELQELNYTKDKFFSIIAHDLKNPFHGLINLSRILLQDYLELSEDDKISFIKSIEELSSNTYKLLENLLDWSRIQTGKMSLTLESFNILAELYQTIALVKQMANNKGIDFSYSISQSEAIYADKNMLTTIIRNLGTNAVKFTEGGGKIVLSVIKKEKHTLFSVSDTGVGIDPDNIEKLFRIDMNIKTTGTAKEKGTGLGLLLCKELVEKHKGEIWAESRKGKGTVFYFTIPNKKE